ncbi:alpha/beta hydrolase [Paenibacillus illinoisensis]|uniref:alpha/beta hydrolase n=1 Tax=Paenibacillus illinoisensis TaxID=59845 RepID=UPI003CECF196
MKVNHRAYGIIAGLVFIFLSWSQSFLINYLIPLGIFAVVAVAANALIVKKHVNAKPYRVLLGISTLFVLSEILWMLADKIGLFVIAQVSFLLIGTALLSFGLGIHLKMKRTAASITLIVAKWALALILIAISGMGILSTANPKPITLYLQSFSGGQNTFEVNNPSEMSTIDDKYQVIDNIQYGETYPNSYLTILTPNGPFDAKRPTYFYAHGGGYVTGDKIQGDPNAGAGENAALYDYKQMIDHGYNVVTINYALTPQYLHPVPVIQLTEAVQFMQKNGEKFGIDMENVVFAGGSAGAHLVAEFTTIQANPEFAEAVGIEPSIPMQNIKALVLDSPALDATRVHNTVEESKLTDYLFGQSLAAYVGQPLVSPDKKATELLNMIPKATNNLPPTFISDGNTATLSEQSRDYHLRLTELGVKTDLYIPDLKDGKEGHGFMATIGTEATETYFKKKLAFLDSLN